MNMDKGGDGEFKCQKEWTRKFVANNFPRRWMNDEWKNMGVEKLYEQQKFLMPGTMPHVEHYKRQLERKKEIEKMNEQIELMKRERNNLLLIYNNGGDVIKSGGGVHTGKPIACTQDGCRGYVGRNGVCGVCEHKMCLKCRESVEEGKEHECDPEILASMKFLRDTTKPCPKCSARIYKVDGCDQMWCVKCHTAFSWRTGRIETRIHNPHYFEWLREHKHNTPARNPEDGCLDIGTLLRHYFIPYRTKSQTYQQIKQVVTDFQRFRIHLNNVDIRRFGEEGAGFDNTRLRRDFLLKFISEEEFKTQTYKRKKNHEKQKDMRDILTLFHQLSEDIVKQALQIYMEQIHNKPHTKSWHNIRDITINGINNLFNYIDNLFVGHAKTYSCKTYKLIHDNFNNFRLI